MAADLTNALAAFRERFLLRAAEDLHALVAGEEGAAQLDGRVHQLAGTAGVFGFDEVGAAAGVLDYARSSGEAPPPGARQALISALERLPRPT